MMFEGVDPEILERLKRMPTGELEALRRDVFRVRAERSLSQFTKDAWHVVEPGKVYKHNWHIDAISDHLEAVSRGELRRLVINVPFRTMKPVEISARVLLADGTRKRLGDVVVGDLVLTHRGRFRRVLAVADQGVLPGVRFTTICGRSIAAANDHPFLTPEGWREAGSLRVRDVLGTPVPHDVEPTEVRKDAEFAMAGYFVSNGNVTEHGGTCAANVTFFDPAIVVDMEQRAAELGWSFHNSLAAGRYTFGTGVRPWLRETGIYGKDSYTKRVPEFVFRGSKRQIGAFIGAYFAGDGTCNLSGKRSPAVSFTSVSRELLADMQHLLLRLGMRSRLRERVHNTNNFVPPGYRFYTLDLGGADDCWRFHDLIPTPSCKRAKLASLLQPRRGFDTEMLPDEIVAIEPAEIACRCLTVEEDESFTAEDIAVHNSTLVSVMWPAWVWTRDPTHQWMVISNAEKLAIRDNLKMRRLIESPWYRSMWGDKFQLTSDQNQKSRFENDKSGYRLGLGITSTLTGEGGDDIILDDPHDRDSAHSEVERSTALLTYDEDIGNRLNEPDAGAIILIMQRLHELDMSGHVLEEGGWTHLMIPMRYEPDRAYFTGIGRFPTDPRTEEGELLWPERFSPTILTEIENRLGSYGTAGQLQQRPSPEGGGILRKTDWRLWPGKTFPPLEMVVAFVDTAYGASDKADHSACVVLGVFTDDRNDVTAWQRDDAVKIGQGLKVTDGRFIEEERFGAVAPQYRLTPDAPPPRGSSIILLHAWRANLTFNQLVEDLAETADIYRCDKMVVEAKASGISVAQELRRRFPHLPLQTAQPPPGDKIGRAYAVQGIFQSGLVYAPDPDKYGWCRMVIDECAAFPNGRYKDLVDCMTMGIHHLRRFGLQLYPAEIDDPWQQSRRQVKEPLY